MATVQIEEAELNTLRESASRVTVLEAENTALKSDADAKAAEDHKVAIESAVAEAFEGVTAARGQAAIVAESLAGEYTVEQTKTIAVEAAAEYASLAGAGKPSGLGATIKESSTEASTITSADIVSALHGGK